MRKLILGLLLLFLFTLNACNNQTIPTDTIDCLETPNHVECIDDPVDDPIDDPVDDPVDCEHTPDDPSCEENYEVNCELTPSHENCILKPDDIQTCEELNIEDCIFQFAIALENGSFEPQNTYQTLLEAEIIMDASSNINSVILQDNRVVAMKYGAINFNTKPIRETTILGHVGFKETTYINGSYNVDGLFLDTNSIFTTGLIAGLQFEVLTSEVELIPHIHTNNGYSYYSNVNNELVHIISQGIKTNSFISIGAIDQAPNFLEQNIRYYSYDNHYFYTDIINMTDDYNSNSRQHAVNHQNPYYNYYQYLSFRSKTNYTAQELDTYISNNASTSSILQDTGDQFINAQNEVFINAAMELSFAIHESGWGTSLIARSKNNLFGINAIDSDPLNSATAFDSIEDCIIYHVDQFLETRYFDPTFRVSFGTNFGNKYQGMNYKYASDAYWGEKIAKHYYKLDKELGFKDYNAYNIALLNPDTLGYYGPTTNSPVIYDPVHYTYYGLYIPFVVMNETQDFYVVQLPLALNNSYEMDPFEPMGPTDVMYIQKDEITLIN